MTDLVLAIDQGTTGTTTVLVNQSGRIVRRAYREIPQHYPKPGWVEHDPEDLWTSVAQTIDEVAGDPPGRIVSLGITNQRETTILWDRATGKPVHPAIVWQCRRTAAACRALSSHEKFIRERTGLPLDAYFSATKIRWILDALGHSGEGLAFGTVDSWILWKLTEGKVHATDFTNASRTHLFNLQTRTFDLELADIFRVPLSLLPSVQPSAAEFGVAQLPASIRGVPIRALVGDQQAALFGQGCSSPGTMKNTYGTGGFLMVNTGPTPVHSSRGLITTLAVDRRGAPSYALEGSVFIAGAAIQWLRDGLGIIKKSAESETLARSVDSNGGVYFVPAFVGLGAPHWAMEARGAIVGLTRGATKAHIARAALESLVYQTRDVYEAMCAEAELAPESIAVDGGAAANDFLLQFQADLLGVPAVRPSAIESTSLGAAALAGIAANLWEDGEAFARTQATDRRFEPAMPEAERERLFGGWQRAVRMVLRDSEEATPRENG